MSSTWDCTCQPAGKGEVLLVQAADAAAICTDHTPSPARPPLRRCSFPSGHASSAFVLSVWVAIYCLWVLNARQPRRSRRALAVLSLRERLVHSLGAAAGLFW